MGIRALSYKFVVVADVHMSNWLPYARVGENGITDRLRDQLRLWKHIYQTAKDSRATAVFVLGDLFDKSLVDPVTFTQTTKALVEGERFTYILSGNHDAMSPDGGNNLAEVYREIRHPRIRYLDSEPVLPTSWLRFWPLPYMGTPSAREKLKSLRRQARQARISNRDEVQILLTHNSINGCSHQGWTCEDGLAVKEICSGFDRVLSGHFHTPQTFGTRQHGRYVGAPMHHHYGDVGRDACYWLITARIRDNRHKASIWECEPIRPGLPRFHMFDDLEAERSGVSPGDYLRYELLATHTDWVELKPKAQELCWHLEEQGYHAQYKHLPIYHHGERLVKTKKGASLSMVEMDLDNALGVYVDSPDVHKGDADIGKLKATGRAILARARKQRGIV